MWKGILFGQLLFVLRDSVVACGVCVCVIYWGYLARMSKVRAVVVKLELFSLEVILYIGNYTIVYLNLLDLFKLRVSYLLLNSYGRD